MAAKSKKPAVSEGADPRFDPVAKAFAKTPGFSIMQNKSGVTRGLMLNGNSFGMSTHGRFILKLSEERAAELAADGTGRAFQPSPGRTMKGWLEVTGEKADWIALAKEAHKLQAGSKAAGRKAKTVSKKNAVKKAPARKK